VHPDLSIKVIAPEDAAVSAIGERVLKRAQWIRKQQRYFEQFLPRTPEREYVSGESHYYLGRKYLLRVRKAPERSVKLMGSELVVRTDNPGNRKHVKNILADWYYTHALRKFDEAVTEGLAHFKAYKIEKPQIVIRRMPRRWGSCTPNGRIILNPEIIKAPSRCIDYVVMHELCHMVHHNHSQAFYKLQNEVMPDWEKWKIRLEKGLS
jgi:predicted metal-dependent hydrolase